MMSGIEVMVEKSPLGIGVASSPSSCIGFVASVLVRKVQCLPALGLVFKDLLGATIVMSNNTML